MRGLPGARWNSPHVSQGPTFTVAEAPCKGGFAGGRRGDHGVRMTLKADRHPISSGSPFERVYGYSRAYVCGDEVVIAGTTGYDYAKMTMPDDVAEQTRKIYATFAEV